MAVKAKAAKKSGGFVSNHPDKMESVGLASGFKGVVTEARAVPWDYDGKLDHDVLAVRLTIEPDEESGLETQVQHYSAGDLEQFAPSLDGVDPVDLEADDKADMEGYGFVAIGKRKGINPSSNWSSFIRSSIAGGVPEDLFQSGDFRDLEGKLSGLWERIPQEKRAGIVGSLDGEQKSDRPKTILVVTEYEAMGKPGKVSKKKAVAEDDEEEETPKAKKGAKAAPAPAKKGKPVVEDEDEDEDEDGDDLAARVEEVIVEALGEADDNTLPKGKLAGLMMKNFEGAEKKAAVKVATDLEFLSAAEGFIFDADEGTLTLAE